MTVKAILAEQIAEVGREIGLRKSVYPKWVQAGKLSQALADRQMTCLEAAYATLKWVQKHEAEIKQIMKEKAA